MNFPTVGLMKDVLREPSPSFESPALIKPKIPVLSRLSPPVFDSTFHMAMQTECVRAGAAPSVKSGF